MACADRTDGSCVAAAVGVARHFSPLHLACPLPWHLAVVACAVVGSAEPVVVGNIAAAAAGSDDGHSSCVGAAVRNAFDGAHILEASGELDVPDAAAAAAAAAVLAPAV